MAQITRQNYFEEAKKFIAALPAAERKKLPTIEDGSANFADWRQYFERQIRLVFHSAADSVAHFLNYLMLTSLFTSLLPKLPQ